MAIKNKPGDTDLIPHETIANKILLIRGKKVMLDRDLAEIYGVETKMLKRAVKRNIGRFPDDFMFQLAATEYDFLRRQFGALKRGQHSKYIPYVFTEHGAVMLASILNSSIAVTASIHVVRAFVKMREIISTNANLKKKIDRLEKKYESHDKQFKIVFEAIKQLLEPPKKPKKKIGF